MSINYHIPIPLPPEKPEATSELFNSRFADLDAGISQKLDVDALPNVTIQTVPSETVINITSGDSLAVIVGKLMRWFSGLVSTRLTAGTSVTIQTDEEGNVTINSTTYDDTTIKTILNKLTS